MNLGEGKTRPNPQLIIMKHIASIERRVTALETRQKSLMWVFSVVLALEIAHITITMALALVR